MPPYHAGYELKAISVACARHTSLSFWLGGWVRVRVRVNVRVRVRVTNPSPNLGALGLLVLHRRVAQPLVRFGALQLVT